jgi:hypothetical protein
MLGPFIIALLSSRTGQLVDFAGMLPKNRQKKVSYCSSEAEGERGFDELVRIVLRIRQITILAGAVCRGTNFVRDFMCKHILRV